MARGSKVSIIGVSLAATLAALTTPAAAGPSPVVAASAPAAGVTELVSQDAQGNPGNGRDGLEAAISGDGNLVAFTSRSANLVPGVPLQQWHVFLRNRQTGETIQVDKPFGGATQRDGGRGVMSFSADGQRLVFTSRANNLVRKDTNRASDVFLYDVATQRITLVSRSARGFGNSGSYAPDISADGRYIAYHSSASNLVANDDNGTNDIFVLDLVAKTVELVSVSTDGVPSNGVSYEPSISGDGRYVAFLSAASTLAPGVPSGNTLRVFLHDRVSGETTLISHSPNGTALSEDSHSVSISADGVSLAWSSEAPDVVAGDTNDDIDVFVTDLASDTTALISHTPAGTAATGRSQLPSISGDGRYVAYSSSADDLTGDDPDISGVFRWDRTTDTTEYVSATPNGDFAAGTAWYANISADGHSVEYTADKNGLVPNDQNGDADVYVWDSE